MTDPHSYLGAIVRVEIDRPVGSSHPDHGYQYPINYGFIPETVSGDGEPIDAYVLGLGHPVDEFVGRCVAILIREEENDPKLIVVSDGDCPSDSEIRGQVDFQERHFSTRLERRRAV